MPPPNSCAAAAAQGAQVVLLQELFATPYFCRTQRGEHFGARPRGRRSSGDRPLRGAGGGARRGAADLVLRARRADPLQLDRDRRRRRHACSASTASRTSPTARATRRSTTSRPAIPVPRVGHPLRPDRRRHLLGPVVPRAGAGDDAAGRRAAALPDCDRLGAARTRSSTRVAIGSARCRATPPPTSSRSSPRIASAPRATDDDPSKVTFYGTRSSPTTPVRWWPRPTAAHRA